MFPVLTPLKGSLHCSSNQITPCVTIFFFQLAMHVMNTEFVHPFLLLNWNTANSFSTKTLVVYLVRYYISFIHFSNFSSFNFFLDWTEWSPKSIEIIWEFKIFNYSFIFFKEKYTGLSILKICNAMNRVSG
jgi:hypothetical protein